MVAHAFDPSSWEQRQTDLLSLKLAWFTEFWDSQSYTEKPWGEGLFYGKYHKKVKVRPTCI